MTVEELRENSGQRSARAQRKFTQHIFVCTAAGCLSSDADAVSEALRKEVLESGMQNACQVKGVGCMGLCSAGPLVTVEPDGIAVRRTSRRRTRRRSSQPRHRQAGRSGSALRHRCAVLRAAEEDRAGELGHRSTRSASRTTSPRAATRRCVTALTEMTPARGHRAGDQERAARARRRGLPHRPEVDHRRQGRRASASTSSATRDEGDPGAFMDRAVLESDPHRVLEGMAIARLRGGRAAGLHLRARRVPAGGQAPEDGHPAGRAHWACWATTSAAPVQLPHRDPARRRARSSAARRRR